MLPTLYKKTGSGHVQSWNIAVNGASYWTTAGRLDGKLTATKPRTAKVKNIGKANATTPEQQAAKDARSKWQKQVDKGFVENLADVDLPSQHTWPMLAVQKLWTPAEPLVFPVRSQPKLDGHRCITRLDGQWSRNCKPITSCQHIVDALTPLFAARPDLILDGELYNHGLRKDFERLTSLIKKQKLTAAEVAEVAANVEYHVYDMPSHGGTFAERSAALAELLAVWNAETGEHDPIYAGVFNVPTMECPGQGTLDVLYAMYLEDGYEGQMIRLDAPYEFDKRSHSLRKRKPVDDAEFEVLAVLEGEGDRAGMAAKFVVDLGDAGSCEINLTGTHELWREWLANKHRYIGRTATVTYQDKTADGKLRFGRFKAWRDDN